MPIAHSGDDSLSESESDTKNKNKNETSNGNNDETPTTTKIFTKKTKQSSLKVNVAAEKISSSIGDDSNQSDENSKFQEQSPESSEVQNNLTNGKAVKQKKDDRFGIIDNVYYRLFYLRHFRFDDISVKMDGKVLMIDARHKTYTDEHGFSTRTFIRKDTLPDYVIGEKLTSYFTGDGVLVIQAPCSRIG